MRHYPYVFALVAGIVLLSGCNATDHPVTPLNLPPGVNAPEVRTAADEFSFIVEANRLSLAKEQQITFSAPQYALIAEISLYGGGTAIVQVRDDQWRTLRSESFTGNMVFADSSLTRRHPRQVTVLLENFTGRLSLTVRRGGDVTEMQSFQMPLEPGNVWRYRVTHGSGYDTVVVRIEQDSILQQRIRVRPWSVRNDTIVQRMFATVLEDTVSFLPMTPTAPDYLFTPRGWEYCPRFAFPLRLRKGWRSRNYGGGGSNYFPSSTVTYHGWASVTAVEQLTVLGRTYPMAFRVDQWPRGDRQGYAADVELSHWIVPGVGIVRIEERVYLEAYANWELISHDPPDAASR